MPLRPDITSHLGALQETFLLNSHLPDLDLGDCALPLLAPGAMFLPPHPRRFLSTYHALSVQGGLSWKERLPFSHLPILATPTSTQILL